MRRTPPLVLALLWATLSGSGCTHVKPWEREILARSDMAFVPDPTESARGAHVYHAKEGSLPGGSAGGGGCGCN